MTVLSKPRSRLLTSAAFLAGTLAAISATAEDNRITLESADGALALEGSFIGFRDGVYVVEHGTLGTLRIEASDEISCTGSACPALEAPIVEVAAATSDALIKLTTGDGRLDLEGRFIELSDDGYVIDSSDMGRLVIELHPDIRCIGVACPDTTDPLASQIIAGSTREMANLLPELIAGYATSLGASVDIADINADGRVPISISDQTGATLGEFLIAPDTAQDAISRFGAQGAALVITDRRIDDRDIAAGRVSDLRASASEIRLAQDALVLVVHADNPMRRLSGRQIAQIWSGEITNWKDLGGPEQPITVNSAITSASEAEIFVRRILGPNGASGSVAATLETPSSFERVMRADLGSIGIARLSDLDQMALKPIEIVEACGLVGTPNPFHIKNAGYPLSKSIYAYAASDTLGAEIGGFAEWLRGPEARDLISQQGYVTSSDATMSLEQMGSALIQSATEADFDGRRFGETVAALSSAGRTTSAFRFDAGSTDLDRDSVQAVIDLSRRLQSGALDGYEIVLVGFSDSTGPADANAALAQRRASVVETALRSTLPDDLLNEVEISTISAGELLPMACNTTEAGRNANRRVEAWLRKSN